MFNAHKRVRLLLCFKCLYFINYRQVLITVRLRQCRVLNPEPDDEFKVLVKHRMSVTAVGLAEDDRRGFSASKDGAILHWDVESGKHEKYLWPNEDVLISHSAKGPQNSTSKRSKNVLSLAVSSDGRYLASGGLDRDVHLWDTRTREHIQVVLIFL